MSTVTTSQSWFSRIGSSIKGVFTGIILILIAIGLLFWNEGRTVKMKKALNEGQSAVVEANIDEVNSDQEGKLIHLSGQLETKDVLRDDVFGVVTQFSVYFLFSKLKALI